MPCKTSKKSKHGETRGNTNDFKSKFARMLEASEYTRLRMEESLPHYHEDRIAGNWDNSLQHYNRVHKLIPMPQAMKIPAAQAAVDKEWEKLEKDSGVGPDKSQKWIRGDRWSKDEGRKSSFCLTDGLLSFEECRIGGRAPKILRSSCTPRRYCKRWFWILCSIHWTGIISISNDSTKVMDIISRLPGCVGQAADTVYAYTQVKMEDAPKLLKIPESECPDIWIRLPRHKWPKLWSSMEGWVVPLERNLYGHPLAGLLW